MIKLKFVNLIRNYIEDNEFKITILKNKVSIINYLLIKEIESDLIIIKYEDGLVYIKGEKLVITKLMNDEVLITGVINNIELRWYLWRIIL